MWFKITYQLRGWIGTFHAQAPDAGSALDAWTRAATGGRVRMLQREVNGAWVRA